MSHSTPAGADLFAVRDWASRRVLLWRPSNTLMTDFCIEAVQEAINRYGARRKSSTSTRAAQAIRSHWQIENRLHWCLDVTFKEDASRIRTGHAPENLQIVKKIAMNLLRLNPLKKSLPKKRLKAW